MSSILLFDLVGLPRRGFCGLVNTAPAGYRSGGPAGFTFSEI